MTPSPSGTPPSPVAAQVDEGRFPQGQCRYILITPGLKGQRCACVTFNHNKAMPGATCDCGHLSCFHVLSGDEPSPGKNQSEIELLKQRMQLLEEQTDWSEHGGVSSVLNRVSQLEESLDKGRDEIQTEIKDSYRNISGAWQLVGQMQRRMTAFEELHRIQNERLERASKELQDLRNRQLELADSDESLEERLERLENTEVVTSPRREGHRRGSILETSVGTSIVHQRRSSISRPIQPLSPVPPQAPLLEPADKAEISQPNTASTPKLWTVHVSLLPSRERPFPFEKDTNAYKRCLSRGLHRMVAVEGQDAESFVAAVSRSFQSVLQGRTWEPLQAKICDAATLQGLPMLRPLDAALLDRNYDADFLREHCAVCDAGGRIESLYVAPRHDKLSWDFLRDSPVFMEGLASSWEYDQYLDGNENNNKSNKTDSSSQGPPLQTPPTSEVIAPRAGLKRVASDMSQGGGLVSPSASNESEASRSKMARTCMPGMVEMRRGVGTAL